MVQRKNDQGISRRKFVKGGIAGLGALGLSGLKTNAFAGADLPQKWDSETDVLIIGAGGTGIVAAIEAAENGAKVTVLEKAPLVGGTTALSGAHIQAAGTEIQTSNGVENDTTEAHYQYWNQAAEGIADSELVRVMADNGPANIKWLTSRGIKFGSVYGVSPIPNVDPGLMKPRIHIPVFEGRSIRLGGQDYVNVLHDLAKKKGVQFQLETAVSALVYDPSKGVLGVKVADGKKVKYLKAKRGVILATGGYDRNKEMARAFSPHQLWALETGKCWAVPTNTGDGIRMAMAVGADLAGLGGTIGTLRYAVGGAPFIGAPELPGIWVNTSGQRFVNEAGHYAYVMRAVFNQPEHTVWAVFDETVRKMGGEVIAGGWKGLSDDLKKEIDQGKIKQADTLNDLAKAMDVNGPQMELTVQKWNQDTAKGKDTLFHKQVGLKPLKQTPFYAIQMKEVNLGSCGGIKINPQTQVLDVNNDPIPGLYAGGMTAGGFIGPYYPGSGTAIAATVCFGRLAGMNAAKESPRL